MLSTVNSGSNNSNKHQNSSRSTEVVSKKSSTWNDYYASVVERKPADRAFFESYMSLEKTFKNHSLPNTSFYQKSLQIDKDVTTLKTFYQDYTKTVEQLLRPKPGKRLDLRTFITL